MVRDRALTDWLEIVIPTPTETADETAAVIAVRVDEARSGTELRAGKIVFWVAVDRGHRSPK